MEAHTMTTRMKLGDRIRQCRKGQRMFVKTLAEKTGVSSNYINMLEHHKRNPSKDMLESIAKVLNVSVEWLETGKGETNTTEYVAPYPTFDQTLESGSPVNLVGNSKKGSIPDMHLILSLLKWQKPDMFPQQICSIMDITEHELYLALDGKPIQCPKWHSACELLLLHLDAIKLQTVIKIISKNITSAKIRNLSPIVKKHYNMLTNYIKQKKLKYKFTDANRTGAIFELENGTITKNDLIFANEHSVITYRFVDFESKNKDTKCKPANFALNDVDKDNFESYITDLLVNNDGEIICFYDENLFEKAYDIAHNIYVNKQNDPYGTTSLDDEMLQFLLLNDKKCYEAYPFSDEEIKDIPWQ